MNSGILAKLFFIALVFLLPFTSSAQNTPYTANSHATLNNAILAANGALDADTINITSDITLSSDLSTIFSVVTINGNGYTIYGGGQHTAITMGGSHGNVTINNLTLAQNKGATSYHGGAILYPSGVSLTLNNVTIRNSSTSAADADGGGLLCNGPGLTIKNSRIHDNSGRKGGGIYLDGGCTNAQITNSSIYDNESTGNGAGIYVASGASVTIRNSSIFGNTSGHRGGGIYIEGGTVTLEHVTIAGNTTTNAQGSASSETGAGLRAHGGTLHMRSSIIYDNIFSGSQENCRIGSSVTVSTLSHNIVGAGSDSGCTSNADPSDPNLAAPSVHGRGKYFIPHAGSPAIDSIPNADCLSTVTTDQRGEARPYPTGGSCDKGAIEDPGYVPPPPPSSPPSDDTGGSGGGGGSDDDETLKAVLTKPVSTCLTLEGIAASNLTESTQCQRLDAMQIANPDIKEGDFVDAVDVWSWVTPNTEICFEALGGSVKFIDTAAMPRTAHEPEAYSKDGMTCAKVDGPGILVLMSGDRPALAAADSATKAAKAAPAVPAAQSLSNCMVRTQFILNFRAAPDGEIVGEVPHNATLTALERTSAWFKVDYHGERGWISAEYVDKKGTCG